MCTLTFVPLEGSRVITANRDESASRNAATLSTFKNHFSDSFLIAKEPLHGGTNLAISMGSKLQVTCLLNGAFYRHPFGEKYRMSRGLMVLESLNFPLIEDFLNFEFDGIEPFTLVRFSDVIEELRWDGQKTHYKTINVNSPHIWSSAQLYDQEIIAERKKWFDQALLSDPLNAKTLADFHHSGGVGDKYNDLVMNRKGMVQTVSISQIEIESNSKVARHWNLIDNSYSAFDLNS